MPCPECSGACEWSDDASALVCTVCGTLSDKPLLVSSPLPPPSTDSFLTSTFSHSYPISHNNRLLPGQSNAARQARSTLTSQTVITSLLTHLSYPSLAPRAQHLFALLRERSGAGWGRKANTAAAAAVVIALREEGKPVLVRDVASLLAEGRKGIEKAVRAAPGLLGMEAKRLDVGTMIPTLREHLDKLLHLNDTLPRTLRSVLLPLSLHAAARTASALATLISSSPALSSSNSSTETNYDNIAHLPPPPTSAALFILALEAEARRPLPLSSLSTTLAARIGRTGPVVIQRYHMLVKTLGRWVRKVPWAVGGGEEEKGKRERERVVKGLKDVVQFQEEILRCVEELEPPRKRARIDGMSNDENSDPASDNAAGVTIHSRSTAKSKARTNARPLARKKRPFKTSTTKNVHDEAIQFLRNPLAGSIPDLFSDPFSSSNVDPSASSSASRPAPAPSLSSLLSPSSPSNNHSFQSRLSLLAERRGGSTPSHIPDEELFEDGEWEGMLRSEGEMEVLVKWWGWGEEESECEDDDDGEAETAEIVDEDMQGRARGGKGKRINKPRGSKTKTKNKTDETYSFPTRKSRIDKDALARVLRRFDVNSEGVEIISPSAEADQAGGLDNEELQEEGEGEDEEDKEDGVFGLYGMQGIGGVGFDMEAMEGMERYEEEW